ncbi:23S rRNA (pseudouridine(1915)-N(3))-methyltransferase RlmH [Peptoniphilus sp.]|jgi:23S rRNA (pseudouridine1915-N3)-methyltransferase|uniref:23S rRNA (pseudouridine(1915)-N(3))-methyltransferase RlmH n=1 Tax=Peptoniphilus sp. TaxID=1971214 RepID=UPI003D8E59BF
MQINIISVGKIKKSSLKDSISEYQKMLKPYVDLKIIEVPDEPCPENLSEKDMERVKNIEGEKILSKIKEGSYTVALAIDGKMLDSVELAGKIENLMLDGISNINFIIGGSLGLSKEVLEKANYKLSFSKMTFPHNLMRLILIEQIYRSFRIINNHPYHK